MSLDGVAQAPGAVDEDPSGVFAHGGWHTQYMDDELAQRYAQEVPLRGVPGRRADMTERQMRDLRERGMPAKRIGKRLVFDLDEVETFLERL
jgi:hypothetical protein